MKIIGGSLLYANKSFHRNRFFKIFVSRLAEKIPVSINWITKKFCVQYQLWNLLCENFLRENIFWDLSTYQAFMIFMNTYFTLQWFCCNDFIETTSFKWRWFDCFSSSYLLIFTNKAIIFLDGVLYCKISPIFKNSKSMKVQY